MAASSAWQPHSPPAPSQPARQPASAAPTGGVDAGGQPARVRLHEHRRRELWLQQRLAAADGDAAHAAVRALEVRPHPLQLASQVLAARQVACRGGWRRVWGEAGGELVGGKQAADGSLNLPALSRPAAPRPHLAPCAMCLEGWVDGSMRGVGLWQRERRADAAWPALLGLASSQAGRRSPAPPAPLAQAAARAARAPPTWVAAKHAAQAAALHEDQEAHSGAVHRAEALDRVHLQGRGAAEGGERVGRRRAGRCTPEHSRQLVRGCRLVHSSVPPPLLTEPTTSGTWSGAVGRGAADQSKPRRCCRSRRACRSVTGGAGSGAGSQLLL